MAWVTPKTNWTASDPIGTADLNRIEGNEAQLRADLDAHTAATVGVHGATSAATANRLVIRDSDAQAHFGTPTQSTHAVRKQELDAHVADYVRQPGFGVTGGSGNAYTVTLSPAPSAYVDGMGVVIRANRDNTGAATLNVNGLGAKSIKRANGLDLAPGMLKSGGIYTLRYSAAAGNFMLQGEGGDVTLARGTATSSSTVLPFVNSNGWEIQWYGLSVSGLLFKPKYILIWSLSTQMNVSIYIENENLDPSGSNPAPIFMSSLASAVQLVPSASVTFGEFTLPVGRSNQLYGWIALG